MTLAVSRDSNNLASELGTMGDSINQKKFNKFKSDILLVSTPNQNSGKAQLWYHQLEQDKTCVPWRSSNTIRIDVEMQQPEDLVQVMNLAGIFETKYQLTLDTGLQSTTWKNLGSNPEIMPNTTTLDATNGKGSIASSIRAPTAVEQICMLSKDLTIQR
ncbi:hypothetical protein V6N12_041968 [Hibiscus sabdariffa]|uniref:Uncharacterized protein n=1 Tax=Hibiscus sabdariffa TaxID=183260 RepID=A0ABR2EDE4_9ROSI